MSEHGKSSRSFIIMINTFYYYINEQGIEILVI